MTQPTSISRSAALVLATTSALWNVSRPAHAQTVRVPAELRIAFHKGLVNLASAQRALNTSFTPRTHP